MHGKHESAGKAPNMPQATRSLHPKCQSAQALSLKTAYPAASGMSMMNLGKYPTFNNRRWHVPRLDFPRSCDILFLAGAFSVLSRVLSVRCRAVARGRSLFLRHSHIKTARADLRAGSCSVSKKPRRVCARRRKESPIIFFGDMCGEENTSRPANVRAGRLRRPVSALQSGRRPLCQKVLLFDRQTARTGLRAGGHAVCAAIMRKRRGRRSWSYRSGSG